MSDAAYETNKSHLQAAVLYVSTYRLESMYCLDTCVFGQQLPDCQ